MIEMTDAPRRSIKIQGLFLDAALIYDEGHELTEGEADVLNQTRCENLRNNFAAHIKKACDENKIDGKPTEDSADLPDPIKAALQKEFDAYQDGYNVGEGARGRQEADPVKRQALQLAVEQVKKALRKKGHKLTDVGTEKINDLAGDAIDKNPAFMKRAEEIVAARKAATEDLAVDLG